MHFSNVTKIDTHTTTDRFNKIYFANDKTGFVVGGQRFLKSTILKTIDGGHTWQSYDIPIAGKALYDITRAPSGRLYTCGFDGKLLFSDDTGTTWQFRQLMYVPVLGLAFNNSNTGLAVGGVSFNAGFELYISGNGDIGTYDSLGYQLNKIEIPDGQTGYVCGYGIALKTVDGGKTWKIMNVGGDDFTGMNINGNDIWLCGYNGSVQHSADAGNTWQWVRNGNDLTLPRYRLLSIVFKNSLQGWAVGEEGNLISTDDGGLHWALYDHFTTDALRSIVICPNGDLLTAGDNGALYRLHGQ